MILNQKDYRRHKRIVKTQNLIRFSKVFLFFGVLILSIVSVYNFNIDTGRVDLKYLIGTEAYKNGPQCGNMSFENTAICLNDFARGNFYYNVTDDSIDLTIQEMMERGGDCRDWTNFYKTYMSYYGFDNSQIVKMFVEKEGISSYYHVFLAISHSSGYCNMDIRSLECRRYINDDGERKE